MSKKPYPACIEGSCPPAVYGTAWKKDATEHLTLQSINAGFRAIDTANQAAHYDEAAVGRAVADGIRRRLVTRDELFLQTKFTFLRWQGENPPYDPDAPVYQQVETSLTGSLNHLQTEYVDALLLHAPLNRTGLCAADLAAWKAMEHIYERGLARTIGVCNVTADQIKHLLRKSRIQPGVVQNRCYPAREWDRKVRDVCAASGIVYQGFAMLTGLSLLPSRSEVAVREVVARIAKHRDCTPAEVIFQFARHLCIVPVIGTKSMAHMQMDLDATKFSLSAGEIREVLGAGGHTH